MIIDDLLQSAAEISDKETGQGASETEIQTAQSALGVTFPESYLAFLRRFGWARFSTERLYGLGKDAPPYLELVKVARSERTEAVPPIPMRLIPIMNDGAGNHFCIDSSVRRGGENPVVFWDHELGTDQEIDFVSTDFAEWLGNLLARLKPGP